MDLINELPMKKAEVKYEAGIELDKLVAEKFMGWKLCSGDHGYGTEPQPNCGYGFHPHSDQRMIRVYPYSSDMGVAWEVVNKIIAKCEASPKVASLRFTPPRYNFKEKDTNQQWEVWFGWDLTIYNLGMHYNTFYSRSPSLAICQAAMAIHELEVKIKELRGIEDSKQINSTGGERLRVCQ